MNKKITILLVDDHQIIRDGVKTMIDSANDMEWVGCATNGEEALQKARCLKPDIIITDISMPEMNGIELTNKIIRTVPSSKVLILTMYTSEDYIYSVIQAGAKGVLPKQDTNREILLEAIRTIQSGQEYYSPSISRVMMKTFVESAKNSSTHEQIKKLTLTVREKEILKLYVEGYTNQEIADKLSISIRTVETHKNNIMQKYNFKTTVEMVKFALRNNLVNI
jgi:DNA-binding NarL/FixJ family response regulator